jgi:hypothetical protein
VVSGRDAGRAEEQADLPLARKGSRPLPYTGAVCPERGTGAAGLQQRSRAASSRRDLHQGRTGRARHSHPRSSRLARGKNLRIPANISLLPLPPRAPELNGQENIWQFIRQNWLSNRIFKSFDDIVDHCRYAWNTLIDQPWKIMSIALRDWAIVSRSL